MSGSRVNNFEILYLDVVLRRARTEKDLVRLREIVKAWDEYNLPIDQKHDFHGFVREGNYEALFEDFGFESSEENYQQFIDEQGLSDQYSNFIKNQDLQRLRNIGLWVKGLSRKNNDLCMSHPSIPWGAIGLLAECHDDPSNATKDSLHAFYQLCNHPVGLIYELQERLFWQQSIEDYLKNFVEAEYKLFHLQQALQAFCAELMAVQLKLDAQLEDKHQLIQSAFSFDIFNESRHLTEIDRALDKYREAVGIVHDRMPLPGSLELAKGNVERRSIGIEKDFTYLRDRLPQYDELVSALTAAKVSYLDYWLSYYSKKLVELFRSGLSLDLCIQKAGAMMGFSSFGSDVAFGQFNKVKVFVSDVPVELQSQLNKMASFLAVLKRMHVEQSATSPTMIDDLNQSIASLAGEGDEVGDFVISKKLDSFINNVKEIIENKILLARAGLANKVMDNRLDFTYWHLSASDRQSKFRKIEAEVEKDRLASQPKKKSGKKSGGKPPLASSITVDLPTSLAAPHLLADYDQAESHLSDFEFVQEKMSYMCGQIAVLNHFSQYFSQCYGVGSTAMSLSAVRVLSGLYALVAIGEVANVLSSLLPLSDNAKAALKQFIETRAAIVHAANSPAGRNALWDFVGLGEIVEGSENPDEVGINSEQLLESCWQEVMDLNNAFEDLSQTNALLEQMYSKQQALSPVATVSGQLKSKSNGFRPLAFEHELTSIELIFSKVTLCIESTWLDDSAKDYAAMVACVWAGEMSKTISEKSFVHNRTLMRHKEWILLGLNIETVARLRAVYCHNLGDNFNVTDGRFREQGLARSQVNNFHLCLDPDGKYENGAIYACAEKGYYRGVARDVNGGDELYVAFRETLSQVVVPGMKIHQQERLYNQKQHGKKVDERVRDYMVNSPVAKKKPRVSSFSSSDGDKSSSPVAEDVLRQRFNERVRGYALHETVEAVLDRYFHRRMTNDRSAQLFSPGSFKKINVWEIQHQLMVMNLNSTSPDSVTGVSQLSYFSPPRKQGSPKVTGSTGAEALERRKKARGAAYHCVGAVNSIIGGGMFCSNNSTVNSDVAERLNASSSLCTPPFTPTKGSQT